MIWCNRKKRDKEKRKMLIECLKSWGIQISVKHWNMKG